MIEQLLKKQMWVINVVFVIAVAYLSANAINMRIDDAIDTTPRIDLASVRSLSSPADPSIEDFNIVLERNVFNSASVLQDTLNKLASKIGLDMSPGNLELIGTMAGRPDISLALISRKSESNKVEVYRWGDKVGEYLITSIERRLVRLEKDDVEEVLKMPDERLAFALNKEFDALDVAEGIKQVGDDERVVDRRLIEDSLENFGSLMRQARIVPHISGGKIDGFKVYRIKEKSLFKQIGLEDGDIIRRVNGTEIQGPEDGLKLFEVFKTSKSITLDLDRKGQKKTLSYSVR